MGGSSLSSKGVGTAEASTSGSRKVAAVCGSVELGFCGRLLRLLRVKDAASHGLLAVVVSNEEHDVRRANIIQGDQESVTD